MIPVHRRWKDQDGFFAKLHWIICQPIIAGIIGSSCVILIAWLGGIFSTFPSTYAQKSELTTLQIRQLSDYRDLESRKLNRDDYIREHTLLREEMTKGFDKMDKADERIFNALITIRSTQIAQVKKQEFNK